MNVLIVNASPRKKGVTSSLLAEVESSISPAHHTEVVRIHYLNIKPCIGCLQCRPDKTCVLPRDDAHILAEKIRPADFLVIGSPVYWGNMPGTLKMFFDRNVPLFEYCEAKAINYIPRPQLRGKKGHDHCLRRQPNAVQPPAIAEQGNGPGIENCSPVRRH